MAYIASGKPSDYDGKAYPNAKGNTECAEFVRQVTGAPQTAAWKKGSLVKTAIIGSILPGTAIATFDDAGKYPTDSKGRHAAIYVSHDVIGITVMDQWNAQGKVLKRVIRFGRTGSRSNNGDCFYVID
jgi:hypothetical protein